MITWQIGGLKKKTELKVSPNSIYVTMCDNGSTYLMAN